MIVYRRRSWCTFTFGGESERQSKLTVQTSHQTMAEATGLSKSAVQKGCSLAAVPEVDTSAHKKSADGHFPSIVSLRPLEEIVSVPPNVKSVKDNFSIILTDSPPIYMGF